VIGVLDRALGSDDGGVSMIPQILSQGRDDVQRYKEISDMLRSTERQLSQKQEEYEVAVEQKRQRSQRLKQQKAALEAQVQKISAKKQRSGERLRRLKARQRAQRMGPPVTGGSAVSRGNQLEIAREDIVSRKVEPMPLERYVKLYKEAAKEYGFARDWYVLAAVGRVESNHGQNMGPSSAGALGPMQFLPSMWRMYGVDGNGDGEANIMDPEDAIPAAAAYLKRGGAPKDWYSALYAYNHADWYVKEVLGVAESYRRMDGDSSAAPYI
jgi:membrane-bound lytic murein transglycosylase B